MKQITNYIYIVGGENADNSIVKMDKDFCGVDRPKGSVQISTADLIKTAINNVPQGGLSPEEMFKRLQALNSLHNQKDAEQIDFENDHLLTIQKCVAELKFSILEAAFYHFVEEIKNIK